MRRIIDSIIVCISILLIGFVIIFSLLPNFVLNVTVTLGGFAIPIFLIIATMIVEIKKSKDIQEKNQIRNFWLKILFIIYLLLLITILFLKNEYRMGGFEDINTFSNEHFETINIIPFATIIGYISGLLFEDININIVVINLATNLLLFAPMGFFIPILFDKKVKNIKQFGMVIVLITILVEILQFITYSGSTDIDDIILNTTGAIIIYMLMKTKFVKNLLNKVIDVPE